MYTVSLTYPLSRIAYSALAMLCGVLHKAHNSLIITPPLAPKGRSYQIQTVIAGGTFSGREGGAFMRFLANKDYLLTN